MVLTNQSDTLQFIIKVLTALKSLGDIECVQTDGGDKLFHVLCPYNNQDLPEEEWICDHY